MVCSRFSAWSKTTDARGFEDVVGDFASFDAEPLEDTPPDFGVAAVYRGQAVHESSAVLARQRHDL